MRVPETGSRVLPRASLAVCLLVLALGHPVPGQLPHPPALSFDGQGDHVVLGRSPAVPSKLALEEFTLEVWARPEGNGVGTAIAPGGHSIVPLLSRGAGGVNFHLGIRESDRVLVAGFREGILGHVPGRSHTIVGTTPIETGRWTHLAATYDGRTWRLYVDGLVDGERLVDRPAGFEGSQAASLATTMDAGGAPSGFFHGLLDEVRIWDRALSQAEILTGMGREMHAAAGLRARWGLGEQEGGTLTTDTTDDPMHGTLVDGPVSVAGAVLGPDPNEPATPHASITTVSRDDDPVLVAASNFSSALTRPIAELFLFRYNSGTAQYEPVPYQIDERTDKELASPSGPIYEKVYDIEGVEDGTLDADDELAFLFSDAGPEAPPGTPFPAGAETTRFVIEITDPRPGAAVPMRWAYLFMGTGLAVSPTSYITYDTTVTGSITTPAFEVGYADRWLLDEYRIFSPCGNGADLIDRLKGRANPSSESEKGWNDTSLYLGAITGPVRGIRYVQGAKSGVNTIHHDVVYRNFWKRVFNLRVHPIDDTRFYVDWLPPTNGTFFSPSEPLGVPVDGIPETVATTFVRWNLVRTDNGGMALVFNLPLSPIYATREAYFVDNLALNDGAGRPDYNDDDDSAYGNHGYNLIDLGDSQVTPIFAELNFYPLCGGVGDADLGDGYQELADTPVTVQVTEDICGNPAPDDTTCDGVDDDCDGSFDEDYVPVSTNCGIGACASTGMTSCVGGVVEDDCTPGTPAPDDSVCNAIDDDCDGGTDEDYPKVPTGGGTCGVGGCMREETTACVGGVETTECVPGAPAPSDTVCNGIDDDCNGPNSLPPMDAPPLRVNTVGPATELQWFSIPDSNEWDVVRGDLQTLTASGGDFTAATTLCLGNDLETFTTQDLDTPNPGEGYFYIVRGNNCAGDGTFDSLEAGQVGSRDDEIEAAPGVVSCLGFPFGCAPYIDEDYVSQSTSCGIGACASSGMTSCVDGAEQDDCSPGTPAPDDSLCNGIDDDCDGPADEDYVSQSTSCGIGACGATGATSCVAGVEQDDCTPGTPAPDDSVCNGIDDDCDDLTDEDFVSQSTDCGIGACAASGSTSCVAGVEQDSCTPGTPALDDSVCNAIDDDCDGTADEDYPVLPTGSTCGVGGCLRDETTACVGGVETTECVPGAPAPNDSVCNGIDDDCNGPSGPPPSEFGDLRVDRSGMDASLSWSVIPMSNQYDLVRGDLQTLASTGGDFTSATTLCMANDITDRSALDSDTPLSGEGYFYLVRGNNCTDDGPFDSGGAGQAGTRDAEIEAAPGVVSCLGFPFGCAPYIDEDYVSQSTSCGIGACASSGMTSCVDGAEQDDCTTGTPALDDATCDGIDDDCDTVADEDYVSQSTNCGIGACAATGSTSCVAGSVEDSCTPGTPALDDATCDGIDDDCDGLIDEDYVSVPTGGSCGVGACEQNEMTACIDGSVVNECTAGTPALDDATCDGVDDDCDGSTDEDYLSQSTNCGLGECASTGSTSCVDGVEQDDCTPGTPAPDDSVCNGLDDDCDGPVDEDYVSTPTGGTCGVGACEQNEVTACVDGSVVNECTAGTPAADDATCDGVDDDCDGGTDEDYVSQSTNCGIGACAATGSTSCVAGSVEDSCTPGTPAADDATCDGIDDDCDGPVDEDYVSTPTGGTCGVGACEQDEMTACVDGSVVNECTAGTPALDDATCDGVDDDCDGTADEDYDPVPTGGVCGVGACRQPELIECVSGQPTPECTPGDPAPDDATCDGIDDDCDDDVDEDWQSVSTECGVGECFDTGKTRCILGQEIDDCQPGDPEPEQCNGKDDDCDGVIDNECT